MGSVTFISVATSLPTAIIPHCSCWKVVIGEDGHVGEASTTRLEIIKSHDALSSTGRIISRGQEYAFEAKGPTPFQAGQVLGFVRAVDMPTTCFQDEC